MSAGNRSDEFHESDTPTPARKPLSELDRLVFQKWAEFAERLAARQGTQPLDFEAIRRRKAEIDRSGSPRDPL